MPLRVINHKRGDFTESEHGFDLYEWWRAMLNKGISPSEAWSVDYIEAAHILELDPKSKDTTFALYHQRKLNGAPDEWLTQNP